MFFFFRFNCISTVFLFSISHGSSQSNAKLVILRKKLFPLSLPSLSSCFAQNISLPPIFSPCITIFFFQTAILLSTYYTFAYQLWERKIFRQYFQGTPLPLVNELPQKLFFTQICGPDISLKDPHLCLWLQPIGPFVAVSYLPLLQTWQSLYWTQ